MRVHVTAEDIEYGHPAMSDHCPVARALKRKTGERWHVGVGVASSGYQPHTKKAHLSRSVQRFVKRFDKGEPVQPFTFLFPNFEDAA